MRIQLIAALALLFTLTGCLTIEENYTFKKNGSGTMEYVVDLSELGELMKSFKDLEADKDKSDDGMGQLDLVDDLDRLKGLPGISKVKLNKKEWVQRISFSFKDINALNAALNQLLPDSTGQAHTFFAWDGNTLVRTNNQHAREVGAGMSEKEPGEEGEEGMDMSAMLGTMKYKYSFTFAQPVANTEAAEGMTRENPKPKVVKLSTDWGAISKDPAALDLRIALDK
jgi:hypothetical protein